MSIRSLPALGSRPECQASKEKSLVVVPRSVDNGGMHMIEIHAYKVPPTPLEWDRQTEANNDANVRPNVFATKE